MTSLCITILVNVVVDALSRKSWGVLANVASHEWQMFETWDSLGCSTVIKLRER